MTRSKARCRQTSPHELRTPLTRLQLGTALLRRRRRKAKSWSVLKPKAAFGQHDHDLLVMSHPTENALVSETMKANQLWGEVRITPPLKPNRWASR